MSIKRTPHFDYIADVEPGALMEILGDYLIILPPGGQPYYIDVNGERRDIQAVTHDHCSGVGWCELHQVTHTGKW